VIQWLIDNWVVVLTPLLVFLAAVVLGLWARRSAYRVFDRWAKRVKWAESQFIIETTRRPVLHWFLLLGAYVAIQISILPPMGKSLAGKILASLFVLSLMWVAISLGERLIKLYLGRLKAPPPPTALALNVARITIVVIGILIMLDLWGAPTAPVILVLAAALFIAGLALRDTVPNFLSGLQVAWGEQIKVGHFIELESGEAGFVTRITWRNTEIKALDGKTVLIPNSKLARTTVVSYGRPAKKATSPFRFYTRLHLKELTGLKASNLRQLISILRDAPDAVLYYHTHHFFEEHQYLTPEPANDFSLWVSDVLGNEALGERLASIDTFDFPSLGALKMRIVDVIEDYLAKNPDGGVAPPGREFHFIRSNSVILPTPYVAHDLGEFVEVLKKISIDSLYFHIFEARLRQQKGSDDFSIWIESSLGEKELADEIARLDPYIHTLESLRAKIIRLIEEHIK